MSPHLTAEAEIPHVRSFALVLALALGGVAPASAQQSDEEGPIARVWTFDELYQSFCVQFLIEPASLAQSLPGVPLLPASAVEGLHPSLRSVITAQPEYASWTPSRLCLLYFGRFEAGGRRIRQEERRKAPMLGLWTVAAGAPAAGDRQDVAVELFTNSSSIESHAKLAGLEIGSVRTSAARAPEDEDGRPSPNDRYGLRAGKAQINWEGRAAGDTVPMPEPLAIDFRGRGRRGGWVNGTLSLTARASGSMIGALKVAGKGELATALLKSPIRFVGPGFLGGGGTVRFQR